ncbi:hypothetical protein ABDK56_07580 [Sphingomonas sp. ASV193]|uniref:hypothetical protein n=1 Tax=Sphingomonas sp. ASV193 TaxID=3144405 RepID=UPI0032E8D9C4
MSGYDLDAGERSSDPVRRSYGHQEIGIALVAAGLLSFVASHFGWLPTRFAHFGVALPLVLVGSILINSRRFFAAAPLIAAVLTLTAILTLKGA